jgi:hypothetical protein
MQEYEQTREHMSSWRVVRRLASWFPCDSGQSYSLLHQSTLFHAGESQDHDRKAGDGWQRTSSQSFDLLSSDQFSFGAGFCRVEIELAQNVGEWRLNWLRCIG